MDVGDPWVFQPIFGCNVPETLPDLVVVGVATGAKSESCRVELVPGWRNETIDVSAKDVAVAVKPLGAGGIDTRDGVDVAIVLPNRVVGSRALWNLDQVVREVGEH